MELSFVVAALRRNGWIVLVFIVLGFAGARSIDPPGTQYESTGLLLLSPSGFDSGVAYANQPDRFVLSQLGVLTAQGLAERVAETVNERSSATETASSVRRSVEMEQELDSDIVVVTATTGQEIRSQLIAQAYLDLYIEEAKATVQQQGQAEIDSLVSDIERVREELTDNETRIQDAMKPFLPTAADEFAKPIPDISLIDPEAAAKVGTLGTELKQLTTRKLTLEADQRSKFNSLIVQNASLPEEPVGNSTALRSGAVVFVAATIGLIIALVSTRFSKRVLDELQASEILGMPIVAEVDRARALRRSPMVAFDNLPSSLIPIIDQLSVRAEALGSVAEPLTVAVVGSERLAGTTTLATAMAGRFSAAEFDVVLVDLDASDPYLSHALGGVSGEGLAAVFTQNPENSFNQTGRDGVTLLGRGRTAVSIRRDLVSSVLDVAKTRAHIVIVDAGSVLDAAANVELCDLVDAVVLCVPIQYQETRSLGHVARQFEPIMKKVLPIITHPSRQRATVGVEESSSTAAPRRPIEPERAAAPLRASQAEPLSTTVQQVAPPAQARPARPAPQSDHPEAKATPKASGAKKAPARSNSGKTNNSGGGAQRRTSSGTSKSDARK